MKCSYTPSIMDIKSSGITTSIENKLVVKIE